MNDKCTKYESLFVFGSEEDLQEHLKTCPDCQLEQEQMTKISGLVKEVAPFINKKPDNNISFLKAAAAFIALFLSFWIIQMNPAGINSNQHILSFKMKSDAIITREDPTAHQIADESIIAQMGLPTDEYGLLVVESN